MNKVSTETYSLLMHFDLKQALTMLKKSGFEYFNYDLCKMQEYDFRTDKSFKSGDPLNSRKYKSEILKIKETADSLSIKCNQTHAPFPIHVKKIYKAQKRAIIATSLLGAEIMVIHPDTFKSVDENVRIIKPIAKFAQKYNVKIAVENAFNWSGTHAIYCAGSTPESLLELINKINEPNVGACLDIGHAEVLGEIGGAINFIKVLKNKIIATHLHDNDRINDKHQIPFGGSMDIKGICEAFKKENYQGFLTLEAINYLKTNPSKPQKMVDDLYDSIMKMNKLING